MIAPIEYPQHSTVFSKKSFQVPVLKYPTIYLTKEEQQISSQMINRFKLPQTIEYKLNSTRMGSIQSSNIKWPQNPHKVTNTRQLMEALIRECSYPESLARAIVSGHFEIKDFPLGLPTQSKNRLSAVGCPDLPSLLYFIRRSHLESGESEFDINEVLNKLNKIDNIGSLSIEQIKTLLQQKKLTTLEKINNFLTNLKPII